MIYKVRLHAYCGMTDTLYEGDDRKEARKAAADAIRYHRNELEYPISRVNIGTEWELESDPDGGHMIGDHEGILAIDEYPTCESCGKELGKERGPICDACCEREDDFDEGNYCENCGEILEDYESVLCCECQSEEDDTPTTRLEDQ